MATTKEKWQEIANKGLQDRFDPATRAKFDEAVRRGLIITGQQAQADTLSPPSAHQSNEDVPTPENLAIPAPGSPDRSFGEIVTGLGEAALTLGTGATSGALSYLASAPDAAINEIRGKEGAFDNASAMAAQNTYSPKTEAGKDFVNWIAEKAGVLPPVLASGPITSVGPSISAAGRFANSKLFKTSRGKRQIVADEIRAGNINARNIAKTLNEDGKLITNPNVKTAIKLIGDEDAGTTMAINIEKMNNATKSQFNKMLDKLRDNKKSGDPLKIMENRPADVIGDSLSARAIKLDEFKRAASKKIGDIINGEVGEKPVEVAAARDKFLASLADSDIATGRTSEGRLVADSSRTLTNIDEVIKPTQLNNILDRLQSGEMTAKEAHKIKRNLRELVSFDPSKPGGVKVSAEIETAIKTLASDLTDSVSKIDKGYARANKAFAESIEGLQKTDKLLGNSLMIGDDLSASKLGALSKRIGTNLASREAVLDMVQTLDDSLSKRGFRPLDDVKRQVAALADLEKIFKVESAQSPFGFQSRVAQGAGEAAITGGVPSREILNVALDKFRGMSKLEFDDKMKALRAMSKKKTQGNK